MSIIGNAQINNANQTYSRHADNDSVTIEASVFAFSFEQKEIFIILCVTRDYI